MLNVKTYRARSLSAALRLIQRELGPEATVLSTRQKPDGLLGRLVGSQIVEVTASVNSSVAHGDRAASRNEWLAMDGQEDDTSVPHVAVEPPPEVDYRAQFKRFAKDEQSGSILESMIEQHGNRVARDLPSTLFRLFTDLLEADVDDSFARGLVEQIQQNTAPAELTDLAAVRDRMRTLLQQRIRTTSPITANTSKRCVVALIGPTGVGKTTTIAKLAANLRLRDKHRVGLITVDTYRIAAVDQLRAYADIIDLPMEVVTTPREMRDAVTKLAELDIVLIDTAGRSPHDEIQIQELKAMLTEARADEVQLVVSSVCHAKHLMRVVEHFRPTNPTSLLLTKLDEATTRGNLLPILCESGLPLSYTTDGQNVPDDIQSADPLRLIEPIVAGCAA